MALRSGIVVGVDGSHHSQLALAWAAREARLRHSPLRVLHAVNVLHPVAGADRAGAARRP